VLTRRGLLVLGSGIVLVLAGWLVGWPELVILGVGAVVVTIIALAWLLVRPKVEVVREIEPDRVPAGSLAFGRVKVFNARSRTSFAFVARERFGTDIIDVPIPRLHAGGRKSTTYRLPSAQRGVIPVGPMMIGRGDPLGLVRAERDHGEIITLWVHPRHHHLEPLPSSLTRSLEGPSSDTAPNGTITFHALREYVMGDDLRQVHWRTTARTGTLMVRQHVDTSLPDATIVVDTSAAGHSPESFEVAMEVVASVALASTTRHFPVQLRTTGGLHLSSRGGGNASQEILDQLAALQPDALGERSLTELLNTLARARGGTALVVVTAAPDPAVLAGVVAMARRYRLVALVDCRPSDVPTALRGVITIAAPDGPTFAAAWNRQVA
jgi:uncharacterized protein (DUF58 family)